MDLHLIHEVTSPQAFTLLRERGLKEGDAVALLCSNRAEFVEVLCATLRGGFRFTPVNWHLNADEVEYIINDCEAKALFADTRYPAGLSAKAPEVLVRISIGADAEGFIPYASSISAFAAPRNSVISIIFCSTSPTIPVSTVAQITRIKNRRTASRLEKYTCFHVFQK